MSCFSGELAVDEEDVFCGELMEDEAMRLGGFVTEGGALE